MGYMIGVDVGGTFTDFSIFHEETGELVHFKHSSTPEDSSKAILSGIMEIMKDRNIDPEQITYLAHGTTVATNALIEKKGGRLALVTTKGFKDLMEIGWQKRPSLYDLRKEKPVKLIPAGLVLEVEERILYDGTVKTALNEENVREVARYLKEQKVESVAVCTLFSFLNPEHELRIKEIIKEEYPQVYISISYELVPEFREYSRMSTTVLNAYLGPVMQKYVRNFEQSVKKAGIKAAPYVTQSNGSIISIAETVDCPIRTAVSGPSAGIVGAIYIGNSRSINKIITFDMGGTSADVSLIENGKARLSNERLVEGYPCRVPMIDIITVGAGGGSLAAVDAGGAMKVGPRSAGASPGPACYMRGGTKPTVTDANIVLGKLNQHKILGGRMDVDCSLAKAAIEKELSGPLGMSVEDAAAGIISVVNSNMIRAIRNVSVERGYDPREFTLMAFGGAGPLHACEIARDIGIRSVLIPPSPGTLCSLGLLMADTRFDNMRSKIMTAKRENAVAVREIFRELIADGSTMLDKEGIAPDARTFLCTVDCRYCRQNYEISVSVDPAMDESEIDQLVRRFHEEHERQYGYRNAGTDIQMVNYRVSSIGTITKPELSSVPMDENAPLPEPVEVRNVRFDGQSAAGPTKVYKRSDLIPGNIVEGPAIIEQMDSTSVIPAGWSAQLDGSLNIFVQYKG